MSGYNPPLIFQKATDAEGNPAPFAKLYHYVTESTILKDLFADFELTTPLPQPLVALADGSFQQYFMEPGYYKFVLLDADNNQLLPPQDHVCGAGAGGSLPVDDHLVIVDETDAQAGTLYEKLEDSAGIFWFISGAPGGVHSVRGEVQAGAGDTYKVKTQTSDATPGFLGDKIANSNTVDLSIVDDKLQATVTGPFTVKVDVDDATDDYLYEKLEDTDGLHWEISGAVGGEHHVRGVVQAGAGDTYKAKVNSSDTVPGFLDTKIKAGSGIVITETTDAEGIKMHIASTGNTNGKVKTSSTDSVLAYLKDKLTAGDNITIVEENGTAGKTLRITAAAAAPVTGYQGAVRAFGSALSIGSSTAVTNVLDITLTEGNWDVCGCVSFYCINPAGTVSKARSNISETSAYLVYDGWDQWSEFGQTGGSTASTSIPMRRFVVPTGTTKTLYLVFQATNTTSTFSSGMLWGNITARQVP